MCHGRVGKVSFAVTGQNSKQSHSQNDLDFKYIIELKVTIFDMLDQICYGGANGTPVWRSSVVRQGLVHL